MYGMCKLIHYSTIRDIIFSMYTTDVKKVFCIGACYNHIKYMNRIKMQILIHYISGPDVFYSLVESFKHVYSL